MISKKMTSLEYIQNFGEDLFTQFLRDAVSGFHVLAAKLLLQDFDRVGSWAEVFKEDESGKDNNAQLLAPMQEELDDYANQELFPFMSNGSSTKVKIYKKKIPYVVYIEISCFPGPDCGDMGFYKLSMDNSCSKIYTIKLLNRIIS
ncbi:MAG: hypothetical protein CK427_16730 [Leptospira sp.]|nr:MAG: hypothetical protein CK427_16730 [Leptospira sp.]